MANGFQVPVKNFNPKTAVKKATIAVLRAFDQGRWGFSANRANGETSRSILAKRFQEFGFEILPTDFENAHRSSTVPREHQLPRLPAVEKFVAAARQVLGDFDESKLYFLETVPTSPAV